MCEPRRPSPAFNLAVWRRPCPGVRRFARHLADLQAEAAQGTPMLNSTSSNLPRSCLRATRSARISRGLIDWRVRWLSASRESEHAHSPALELEFLFRSYGEIRH
jgi:hypothetical protein